MVYLLKRLHHIYLAVFLVLLIPLNAHARVIRVGIGFALPPYVIREADSGLEVDLIRRVFEQFGYETKFVYLPNLRLPLAFAQEQVDCIVANATYDVSHESGRKAYHSDVTIFYQNYAITLPSYGRSLNSFEDIAQEQVLGFNNATKYLGDEFASMAASNPHYSELADQSLQVRMLYSGRVRVVISDKRIFLWWRRKMLESGGDQTVSLAPTPVFHSLFPPAPRHLHFAEKGLCELFNKGLKRFRKSGELHALITRYLGNEIQ